MKLDNLPNEILIECFDYLNVFEIFHAFDQLNIRFNQLIRSIPLHVDCRPVGKILCDEFCQKVILDREIQCQIISLKLSNEDDHEQIDIFLSYFSTEQFIKLQTLTLYNCHCDKTLQKIIENLSLNFNFRYLYLMDNCFTIFNPLTLNYLSKLKLESLSLSTWMFIQPLSIQMMTLKSLKLDYCDSDDLCQLFPYTPLLKYLNIQNLGSFVTEEYQHNGVYCLEELKLNIDSTAFDDLEIILKQTPYLKKLQICSDKCMDQFIEADRWKNLIKHSLCYLDVFQFYFTAEQVTFVVPTHFTLNCGREYSLPLTHTHPHPHPQFIVLAMNDRRLLTLMIAEPDDLTLQNRRKLVKYVEDSQKVVADDDRELEWEDDVTIQTSVTPISSFCFVTQLNNHKSLSRLRTDEKIRSKVMALFKNKEEMIDIIDIDTDLSDIRQKTLEYDQKQIKGIQFANAGSKCQVHVDQQDIEEPVTVEHFDVVWFNERPQFTLLQDPQYSEQILALEGSTMRFFEDFDDCGYYLYELPTSAKVILIVQGQFAEEIINVVHCLCPIKVIFVVHSTATSTNDQCDISSKYVKVKHIDLDEIANRIRWFEARFLRNTKEFFSINIFKAGQVLEFSTVEINGRFLFTQLLLDILLRMEPKLNDKDELITLCTELFANNTEELKKVKKFHLEYKSEKVFEWYTRDTFVYRLLNKAFRTQNIDLLFQFRFILQDMENQLATHQEQSLVHVYRGQQLSKNEWIQLFAAKNHYISMNSFLSASLLKDVALLYINQNNRADAVNVLFEISADPKLPGGVKPFANVSRFSQFPEEQEVLFMAGSIFHIMDVISGSSFSTVKMELGSKDNHDIKLLFETLRSEYGGEQAGKDKEASLNSFGTVLYNMNRLDIADRFFRRIYYETPNDDKNRNRYCLNIGNVALRTGRYEESGEWYDRALKLCESQGLADHLLKANIYLVRGNLYSMQNRRNHALDSYNKALTIYRKNFDENHPKIAMCYSNIAGLFERRAYYGTALEYREKALNVAIHTLPIIHPELVHYNLCLANLLLELRHRNLQRALKHTEKALEIAQKSIPSEHPTFSHIYLALGYIYELMRDIEQSTFWYKKVDDIGGMQIVDTRIQRKKLALKEGNLSLIQSSEDFQYFSRKNTIKDVTIGLCTFEAV
ncbi:hypothetical protein I4U23_016705 [Adineta vaga]|nr:hypothetical protein I4U23_016705 [Adineta vaga]